MSADGNSSPFDVLDFLKFDSISCTSVGICVDGSVDTADFASSAAESVRSTDVIGCVGVSDCGGGGVDV